MSGQKTFNGSCRCGNIQYQLKLSFPPTNNLSTPDAKSVRLYKCNCSTCHKMNFFHCRPAEPASDFILTSPSDVETLGVYRCFNKWIDWVFCKECGVRPFALGGRWAQDELDVDAWADRAQAGGESKPQKVWKTIPVTDRFTADGKPKHYVSVNAVTLDGADLIDWEKNGWLCYVDSRDPPEGTNSSRFKEPFPGGCH